jgi:hypothetical protein
MLLRVRKGNPRPIELKSRGTASLQIFPATARATSRLNCQSSVVEITPSMAACMSANVQSDGRAALCMDGTGRSWLLAADIQIAECPCRYHAPACGSPSRMGGRMNSMSSRLRLRILAHPCRVIMTCSRNPPGNRRLVRSILSPVPVLVYAALSARAADIVTELRGIKLRTGRVHAALFDNADDFSLDTAFPGMITHEGKISVGLFTKDHYLPRPAPTRRRSTGM